MNNKITEKLNNLCFDLGQDPFLVQGAGGNVSIKDDNLLWVKASGTALSHALNKNIFVPVDLESIKREIKNGNYSFSPSVTNNSSLRPSIETLLHGIMKHKVVIHLHMISALRFLIKSDAHKNLLKILGDDLSWGYVKYCKPGENLARAVTELLKQKDGIDIIFLENHGVVLGAESVELARKKLETLDNCLGKSELKNKEDFDDNLIDIESPIINFDWCANQALHNLTTNENLFGCIENSWALFPDHVVFLGHQPLIVDDTNSLKELNYDEISNEPFIFVKKVGILQNSITTQAQIEQLLCYFNVISNIADYCNIKTLTDMEISELLNWDAEVYRQALSKID